MNNRRGSTFSVFSQDFGLPIEDILQESYTTMNFSDTILICSDGRLEAHRAILRLASPFLRLIFDSLNQAQCNNEMWTIVIPDIDCYVMKQILSIIYTGKIPAQSIPLFSEVQEALNLFGIASKSLQIFELSSSPDLATSSITVRPGGQQDPIFCNNNNNNKSQQIRKRKANNNSTSSKLKNKNTKEGGSIKKRKAKNIPILPKQTNSTSTSSNNNNNSNNNDSIYCQLTANDLYFIDNSQNDDQIITRSPLDKDDNDNESEILFTIQEYDEQVQEEGQMAEEVSIFDHDHDYTRTTTTGTQEIITWSPKIKSNINEEENQENQEFILHYNNNPIDLGINRTYNQPFQQQQYVDDDEDQPTEEELLQAARISSQKDHAYAFYNAKGSKVKNKLKAAANAAAAEEPRGLIDHNYIRIT